MFMGNNYKYSQACVNTSHLKRRQSPIIIAVLAALFILNNLFLGCSPPVRDASGLSLFCRFLKIIRKPREKIRPA